MRSSCRIPRPPAAGTPGGRPSGAGAHHPIGTCGRIDGFVDSTPLRKRPSRRVRPWLTSAALVFAAFAAAGCGGEAEKDTDDGWYTLVLVPEAGTDPFADPDAEFLYLRIEESDLTLVDEAEFALSLGEYELDEAPTGGGLYFVVEVRDGQVPRGVIARGRSGPHTLEKDEHTTVTVVLEAVP